MKKFNPATVTGSDGELLACAKTGKENFDWACTVLLSRHRNLIIRTAMRFGNPMIPLEDKVSVCQIGFCQSIKEYDPVKSTGLAISTFATWKMRGELKKLEYELFSYLYQEELKNNLPQNVEIDSIHENIYEDIDDSRIESPFKELCKRQAVAILQSALKQVSERDRFVFEHMLGLFGADEMSGEELAEELEISHQRIYQIFKRTSEFVYDLIQGQYKIHDWTDKPKRKEGVK